MIRIKLLILLMILLPVSVFAADRIPSPDKTLTAVIDPFLKTSEKADENVIKLTKKDGTLLAKEDFRSSNKQSGQIIDKIQWTSDSNFLVFSTYNSGGHQPWQSPTFFFARSDHKIRAIDKILGKKLGSEIAILDSDFEISGTSTLKLSIKDMNTGEEKILSIDLFDLITK